MKRASVKDIDYWTYLLGVSALLVFFVFWNMELVLTLSESAIVELRPYFRSLSLIVVPLYAMFYGAVAFTVISSVFLKKTYAVDGLLPSVSVGIAFAVIGILNQSIWPYMLGAVAGIYIWFYVVKFLSIFLESFPKIVDSQTWSDSTLDFDHDAPNYWVWIMNVSYVLSVLSFPIFFAYSLSLDDHTWALALLGSSFATSVGLFHLKRGNMVGYFFYCVPAASVILFFVSPGENSGLAFTLDNAMFGKLIMTAIPILIVSVSCFANWSRSIREVFEQDY